MIMIVVCFLSEQRHYNTETSSTWNPS